MTATVHAETGFVLDPAHAEQRATRIGLDLDGAAERFESAMEKMRKAIRDRDDLALGYRSPGDYLSDRFGGKLARLGVDLRREVVRELTEVGLSSRALAPVFEVSDRMIRKDQAAVRGGNPVPTSSEPAEPGGSVDEGALRAGASVQPQDGGRTGTPDGDPRPASTFPLPTVPAEASPADDADPQVAPEEAAQADRTRQRTDDTTATTGQRQGYDAARPPAPAASTTVGRDGKTYPRHQQRAQKRPPLTDTYLRTLHDLRRRADSLIKLTADDRYDANRAAVTGRHGSDALRVLTAMTTAVVQLDPATLAENEEARQWWLTSLNEITGVLADFGTTLKES